MMNFKKVFALFLTLCMVLSVVPFAAWAEEETAADMPEPEIEEIFPAPDNMEAEEVLPTDPVEPAEAVEESVPEVPVEEIAPAAPAEPVEPEAPEEPVAPANSDAPSEQPTEKSQDGIKEAPEAKETAKPKKKKTADYPLPKVIANGGEYFSLAEALADIGEGESDVVFLEDLSENITVEKNQNITLIFTDYSFSGEIINYGKLTVFGSESGFDGCIITRAYCEKDEDGNVVDEASGETIIEDGSFNGELIIEQKANARVNGDALPKLTLNSGRFAIDLTKRYLNWDEDEAEPEYSASAGSIEITGGVFFTDPSAYVAEGFAAYANDGWWLVAPETEEIEIPVAPEGNPVLNPEISAFSDDAFANVLMENEGPSDYQPVPESVSAEEKLEKQTQKIVSIDVDINITGNGSVVFEGDEYGKGSTLKFAAYSEPVLTIKPAENWKIYNVTVGSNGSATQYGTADTIQLPALESYATVNVIFAEMKPEEIEAQKAESNEADSNSVPEEQPDGQPEDQPEEDTEDFEEESKPSAKTSMITSSRPMLSSARGSSPLLGAPSGGGGTKPEEYTITYVPNGGTFITGVSATKTYTAGDEVIFPTETEISKNDSKGFAGWYDDPDFKTPSGTYLPSGSTGNKTFYARWKYEIVVQLDTTKGNGTVIWNSSEGDKPISTAYTIPAYSGDSLSLKYNPAKNNIVSSVTLADGTKLTDLDKYLDDSVSKNETITVAFERAVTHTVTFDFNDGSTPNEDNNWPVGKEVNFTAPTRDGYVFKGWLCEDDQKLYPDSGKYTVSKSVTFTAQWELAKYTLTYQSNGGTALAPVKFTIEDTVPLSIPNLEGATFEGWYLNADFSGDPVTEITGKDYPRDVTVYAKWKYTMCKVTYVYNDGATANLSSDVKYGTTLTLPSRTRSGYAFKGWKCSADGKIYPAYTRYTVKSDVTFTAQWEKQKVYYKVSVYHTNNGAVYYNGQPLLSGASFELEEGETAALKFAATASGYYVYNCTVNNVRRGSVEGLTVGPIKENTIISVTFAPTFVRPITGDANHLMLWACLMAASALGIAGIPLLRKKRRVEK